MTLALYYINLWMKFLVSESRNFNLSVYLEILVVLIPSAWMLLGSYVPHIYESWSKFRSISLGRVDINYYFSEFLLKMLCSFLFISQLLTFLGYKSLAHYPNDLRDVWRVCLSIF